jgi:hypothetical protein
MSPRIAFAPYRIPPGALTEEAARRALERGAEPLLVPEGEPLPSALLAGALASIPAGHAGAPEEACRGADGSLAGSPGLARACLNS